MGNFIFVLNKFKVFQQLPLGQKVLWSSDTKSVMCVQAFDWLCMFYMDEKGFVGV